MHSRAIFLAGAMGALSAAGVAQDARACGGCFHERLSPTHTQTATVVTDHRMIFVISPQQTTLYDQIKYSGSPIDFAWVLPIRGQVTVGLSAESVFAALEQTTASNIIAPPSPPCPVSTCGCAVGTAGHAGPQTSSSGGSAPPPAKVTVVSEQTIGPYATVQLKSTDANALNSWLTANGYDVPADVQPIIGAYVAEGFDFLALKLAPGQGVQAMRPVRVTTPGAGVSLPLRMVAAGTGATIGITLWVLADGRYEPENFWSFTISPSDLTWDWFWNSSNYTTIARQKESLFNKAAWQIESSLEATPYSIQNLVLQGPNDYITLPPGDGGSGEASVPARLEDLAVLFPEGSVPIRITRMRADLSRAALATDLVLWAAADQATLSNVYQVTQSVNFLGCYAPPCNCPPAPSGSSGAVDSTGSSGGVNSSGSSGGKPPREPGGTSTDGGGSASEESPSRHASCAASTTAPSGTAVGFGAAGVLAVALLRGRRRR